MQFGKGILPAKEYLSNGLFSIQNCYSEAESSFNQQLHFHDFYELSLIYEGSSRFLINGSSFVAAAGSLQLIRPSDYHRQMTDTGKHILQGSMCGVRILFLFLFSDDISPKI